MHTSANPKLLGVLSSTRQWSHSCFRWTHWQTLGYHRYLGLMTLSSMCWRWVYAPGSIHLTARLREHDFLRDNVDTTLHFMYLFVFLLSSATHWPLLPTSRVYPQSSQHVPFISRNEQALSYVNVLFILTPFLYNVTTATGETKCPPEREFSTYSHEFPWLPTETHFCVISSSKQQEDCVPQKEKKGRMFLNETVSYLKSYPNIK